MSGGSGGAGASRSSIRCWWRGTLPACSALRASATFAPGRGTVSRSSTRGTCAPMRAAALNKHVIIGGVDADNAPSIRFHERLGFERAGRLREVGYKFERWLDLVFLQRRI